MVTAVATQELRCACGATRHAPTTLHIISCVHCGAAMSPASSASFTRPPSRTFLAAATLATQLLGTLAFALALFWLVVLSHEQPVIFAVATAGAGAVFAGGAAHRGNLPALATCAAFDLALAAVLLARIPAADALLAPGLARLSAADHLALASTILGALAATATVACVAAFPQARRFAAWVTARIAAN